MQLQYNSNQLHNPTLNVVELNQREVEKNTREIEEDDDGDEEKSKHLSFGLACLYLATKPQSQLHSS